jgi:hypothetical protein
MFNRLNYIYGAPAYRAKRESARYNLNFCLRPKVICYESTPDPSGAIQDTSSIKYLLGMIEWMDRIQSYSWGCATRLFYGNSNFHLLTTTFSLYRYWDYIERLKTFVDNGMVDFSFIDDFSTMVVKSPDDADLRKATFKELLLILFSELKPNQGSQETTIPLLPADFETNNPSKSPAYTSVLQEIDTSSPTENAISPAPIAPPEAADAENPNTPDLALPANTRVDLTNKSQTAFLSVAVMCITIALVFSHLV